MPTINDHEEIFQERVEELYVLAKRMDERAEDLKETAKQGYAENEKNVAKLVAPLIDKIGEASQVIAKLDSASEKVDGYINICAKHIDRRNFVSIVLMGLCGLSVLGTTFWVKHADNRVSEANLRVAQADATLGHKPIYLPAASGMASNDDYDYVRIMPDTQTTMTHKNGKDYPGVYAKIWHNENNKK